MASENTTHIKANKNISDLKEDKRLLSQELQDKQAMLTSCLDLAHEQSLHIASLKVALQDIDPWDTSTCPRPSSSSTPSLQSFWAEVVIRDRKRPRMRLPLPLVEASPTASRP